MRGVNVNQGKNIERGRGVARGCCGGPSLLPNGHTASVFGRFLTLPYTAYGHTAHARRPRSRQFLVGLRVECIKMEEQLLLLENPLLKILLEEERSDWVIPIFDEREKCGEFHTLFPMLLQQALKFFSILEWGPTHSGTFYIM